MGGPIQLPERYGPERELGRGVVHRDVKPSNGMVRADGNLVVRDFGLGQDAARTRIALTQAGTLLGTPAYISREVVCGEPFSPASEQFAWGAVVRFLRILGFGRIPSGSGPTRKRTGVFSPRRSFPGPSAGEPGRSGSSLVLASPRWVRGPASWPGARA